MEILRTKQEVFEAIKYGKYVVRYVLTSEGRLVFISAYHLCDYGLEAFSIDPKSITIPHKLRRANVYFSERIEELYDDIKCHIDNRWDASRGGYMICNELLDLNNIDSPCRFSRFQDARHRKVS